MLPFQFVPFLWFPVEDQLDSHPNGCPEGVILAQLFLGKNDHPLSILFIEEALAGVPVHMAFIMSDAGRKWSHHDSPADRFHHHQPLVPPHCDAGMRKTGTGHFFDYPGVKRFSLIEQDIATGNGFSGVGIAQGARMIFPSPSHESASFPSFFPPLVWNKARLRSWPSDLLCWQSPYLVRRNTGSNRKNLKSGGIPHSHDMQLQTD